MEQAEGVFFISCVFGHRVPQVVLPKHGLIFAKKLYGFKVHLKECPPLGLTVAKSSVHFLVSFEVVGVSAVFCEGFQPVSERRKEEERGEDLHRPWTSSSKKAQFFEKALQELFLEPPPIYIFLPRNRWKHSLTFSVPGRKTFRSWGTIRCGLSLVCFLSPSDFFARVPACCSCQAFLLRPHWWRKGLSVAGPFRPGPCCDVGADLKKLDDEWPGSIEAS